MVGSAILRQLSQDSSNILITAERAKLDLTNPQAVHDFLAKNPCQQIYLAAAKVGGIHANQQYPADFIYENLMITANIIHAAHQHNVPKLLFLGSSCIYPKHAAQPMAEETLLTGALEATNEPYAIAKIAGIKLCESYNRQYGRDYRSVMPANLYGENDNFHPENAHVIPALIRRFHEAKLAHAKEVVAWGSGAPKREFLHVDDMARACIFVMNLERSYHQQQTQPMCSHINIGCGRDYTIKELTEMIAKIVGFQGKISWDTSKPDGTPRKLLDSTRLKSLGWQAQIGLTEGLTKTYQWFVKQQQTLRSY